MIPTLTPDDIDLIAGMQADRRSPREIAAAFNTGPADLKAAVATARRSGMLDAWRADRGVGETPPESGAPALRNGVRLPEPPTDAGEIGPPAPGLVAAARTVWPKIGRWQGNGRSGPRQVWTWTQRLSALRAAAAGMPPDKAGAAAAAPGGPPMSGAQLGSMMSALRKRGRTEELPPEIRDLLDRARAYGDERRRDGPKKRKTRPQRAAAAEPASPGLDKAGCRTALGGAA